MARPDLVVPSHAERIRLGGVPVSRETFKRVFWDTYKRLEQFKGNDSGMPAYFRFLTIMVGRRCPCHCQALPSAWYLPLLVSSQAFRIFLEEGVDVAVVEVGLGGRLDATNVIERPAACAVTLLGMDHMELLGPTIDCIAYEKAGIMKPGVPCLTVEQDPVAMPVLVRRCEDVGPAAAPRRACRAGCRFGCRRATPPPQRRAQVVGCPLLVVPPLGMYAPQPGHGPVVVGLNGDHQRQNAAVALGLGETLSAGPDSLPSPVSICAARFVLCVLRARHLVRTADPHPTIGLDFSEGV